MPKSKIPEFDHFDFIINSSLFCIWGLFMSLDHYDGQIIMCVLILIAGYIFTLCYFKIWVDFKKRWKIFLTATIVFAVFISSTVFFQIKKINQELVKLEKNSVDNLSLEMEMENPKDANTSCVSIINNGESVLSNYSIVYFFFICDCNRIFIQNRPISRPFDGDLDVHKGFRDCFIKEIFSKEFVENHKSSLGHDIYHVVNSGKFCFMDVMVTFEYVLKGHNKQLMQSKRYKLDFDGKKYCWNTPQNEPKETKLYSLEEMLHISATPSKNR